MFKRRVERPYPTTDPEFAEGKHPHINVFQVMPVRRRCADGVLNLATYVDPQDVVRQRSVAERQRWVQGVNIVFEEAHRPSWDERLWSGYFPEDVMFSGRVVSPKGVGIAVTGLLHPALPGWIAFEENIGLPKPEMPTIADLKAIIGKIDPEQAQELSTIWHEDSAFHLDTGILS